ncbi:helix-turn-helix domain-containing protein [Mycobacterium sp. 852013-51886_SCH5428379]|uniref:helix-turn-helix domain-containing protein n=1 Tax=Mycobacterium sp. 852013-51886_SCH5428379 TaxID=1834111 RepID=UPI000ACB4621
MTLAERCVLLAVWDYSNADGTNAYAGVQRIAEDVGINERTVRRALQALCAAGWLRKESTGGRSGDGARWASVYSLTVPSQPDIDDTQPDTRDTQPDIDDMSTGPQTLPPEPLPNPLTPDPDTSDPVAGDPAPPAVVGRFPHHDKRDGYQDGCQRCEWDGRVCTDHYRSDFGIADYAAQVLTGASR